jgi:hypothetical protein
MPRLSQVLKSAGLALVAVGILARLGMGLYAASSEPSLSLLSWEWIQTVFSAAARREAVPSELRLALGMAIPLGAVLWVIGWLAGLRRSPS